jgi:hypothetical protein
MDSSVGERDCTTLLIAMAQLAKDGSHLIIERQVIPRGLARLARPTGEHLALSVEDHAILTQTFLAVEDYFGLLQVRIISWLGFPARIA